MNATTVELEINKCSKCGKCLSVCPVYRETLDEVRVARGRIALFDAILKGELRYTAKVRESIETCLKCLRCSWICINGIEFDRIITGIRAEMPEKAGFSLWNKFVFRWILPRRKLMDLFVRLFYWFQFFLPRREAKTRHIPLFYKGKRRIPELSKRFSLDKYGTNEKAVAGEKSVYLFTGCMMNYVYANVVDSMVNVLEHFGYRVIIPKGQVCCGTPVLTLGDVRYAKRLAEMNLRVFEGDIPIITGCASGGRTLKNDYRRLLGDEGERFSNRVYDFVEFIDKFIELDSVGMTKKVIYHDPCHLRYGQDVYKEPRRVLEKVADYKEIEGADYCCGMGGLFSIYHYTLSTQIAERKTDSIKKSDAEVLVTECPGCMLQLEDRLAAEGIKIDVKHTAEVLDEILSKSKR